MKDLQTKLLDTFAKLRAGTYESGDPPFPWFATDCEGHVAILVAYWANVPEEVCKVSESDYLAAISFSGYFTDRLIEGLIEFETPTTGGSYYERLAVPSVPRKIDSVPEAVRAVFNRYRFSNSSFVESSTIYLDDSNWQQFIEDAGS